MGAIGTGPVAVAVSGGPDSLALLWLAARAWPGRTHALTVDHALRPESAREAAAVATVAAALAVPHATLVWMGRKPRANLAARARRARYVLMADWCEDAGVRWLLTGHHADDQAETVLMRLARGSGAAGLAGVRAVRPLAGGAMLARPLLAARKADLVALCEAERLPYVDDPSNADPARDRTRARALLAATPWLRAERIAASAAHLADAEDALAWAEARAWAGNARVQASEITIDAEHLPRALRLRLLARALAVLSPRESPPSGPDLARLLTTLDRGQAATLAGVGVEPGRSWRFVRETW